MTILNMRPADECLYDEISLGEVMLRLDPGEGRIKTARSLHVWEGGGEYNVAKALSSCFGLRTALLSAFADNEVGRLLEGLIRQGGVDASLLKWVEYDGVGRSVRNGLNFSERGFGVRGAAGVSDRWNTAASQIVPEDFDWDYIFGKSGARWFHTGGIFAAIGKNTAEVVITAMKAARRHGVIVSYDLNYRPSLWKNSGGLEKAQELNGEIAKHVDVMIGVPDNAAQLSGPFALDSRGVEMVREKIARAAADHPHIKVIATTLRDVKSANLNDWGAICWAGGNFFEAPRMRNLEIMDRIGGGDGYASGLIYGLLSSGDPQEAVNLGCAHGALAMTTPGDTSMASLAEVKKLAAGGSPVVDR